MSRDDLLTLYPDEIALIGERIKRVEHSERIDELLKRQEKARKKVLTNRES